MNSQAPVSLTSAETRLIHDVRHLNDDMARHLFSLATRLSSQDDCRKCSKLPALRLVSGGRS